MNIRDFQLHKMVRNLCRKSVLIVVYFFAFANKTVHHYKAKDGELVKLIRVDKCVDHYIVTHRCVHDYITEMVSLFARVTRKCIGACLCLKLIIKAASPRHRN
jgi:hypothetical protein